MANPRPPDRTVRYRIRTASLPSDLSNAFFSRTQVPHTKCFHSGPYVIVGLASEADLEQHTTDAATESLKLLGFDLVESPEQISAKTVLARRVDDYILSKTPDRLRAEIEEKNQVTIDDLKIITKAHLIKIRLHSRRDADVLKNSGIKVLSQIVP